MKKIIDLVKFTFFTTPKNAAMWAEQNEKRITAIWSFMIFVSIIAVLLTVITDAFIK